MRATTVRRLLVFGVCALGVGGLYLVPSIAVSPSQLGTAPQPERQPSPTPNVPVPASLRPTPTAGAPTRSAEPAQPPGELTGQPPASVPVETAATDSRDRENHNGGDAHGERAEPRGHRQSASPTAVATDPNDHADRSQPASVTEIKFADVTPDNVTVKWAPALDNVGVVSYRVWMNGFAVATTSRLQATIDWFNDDTGQHVFQVRAMDAAGNQSEPSGSVLLNRPSPGPTSSPTPTPEPSSPPTPSESPTAEPTQPSSTAPSDPPSTPSPLTESSPSGTSSAGHG